MTGAVELDGLSAAEAERRLREVGPNDIQKSRSRSLWAIIRGTLREPMFLLLVGAACLYLWLGDRGEGLFMAFGALLAIGLVVTQEARSERALRLLRSLAQPYARVIRNGSEERIEAQRLVPGDLLIVSEGERTPADARLLKGDVLSIDESMLTGESALVTRQPASASDATENVLLAGSLIISGAGVAEVTATGNRTALGRIGASLAETDQEPTALQKTTHKLVGYLAIGALGFCAAVFVAYGLLRGAWLQGALAAITVAISLVPEEFPMVLAVFLALGSWRLARHNVLVRRSAATEALGGATVLCADKTGTLTQNQMEVQSIWADGQLYDRNDNLLASPALRAAAYASKLASAAQSIDPMDRAILRWAQNLEHPPGDPLRKWPLTVERLAVIQVWSVDRKEIAAAKGAPEAIFGLCRLSDVEIAGLREVVHHLADKGLRVLGVARARDDRFPDLPEEGVFEFLGLVGFVDPLRDDASAALAEARGAGIEVVMITGDHPSTALSIARDAGISSAAGVLTGADIEALDDVELKKRLDQVRVFARIKPEQKLRLVNAFRDLGEVVVMTGDGVNDAPALQAADIGIAMGKRGTDVAREAADIVLLDDSFASIVGGIRLGRRIFANLRKALSFITAIHVPLAGLALAPVLLGWPPLFLPMQVVLLELLIDPLCSLVFEATPSERDAMRKPPRRRTEALFGRAQLFEAIVQGVLVFVAMLIFFGWALTVSTEEQARAAAFTGLAVANLVLALASASWGRFGFFGQIPMSFWIIAVAALAVVCCAVYWPPLSGILRMAPPATDVLAIGAMAGALASAPFWILRMLRSAA